ncbi:tyrosine-type recombinase/integrase [Vibrio marisflavi]|nr:tyrosine-type recombinase/integrase [Vibrio marisflavi]
MTDITIGEESRHRKRVKHIEKVTTKARQFFERAFSHPDKITDQQIFAIQWQKFESQLLETFGQKKDFRTAFKHGERLLRHYNARNNTPYSPTSKLVTHAPPAQFRDKDWLTHAWALYDAYSQWREEHLNVKTNDPSSRFQSVMLSCLFESGHGCKNVILSLNHLFSQKRLPQLKQFGCYTYLELTLKEGNLNTNDFKDGEPVTIYQCYLSIETLAQLNLWRKVDKSHWRAPENGKALYKTLTKNMGSLEGLPKTLKTLGSCSLFWYERHVHNRITEALLEYRAGRTHSYSIPSQNLERMVNPTLNTVSETSFYHFATNVKAEVPSTNKKRAGCVRISDNKLYEEITRIMKPPLTGEKLRKSIVFNSLNNLIEQYELPIWQYAYVRWLIFKLDSCEVSSVRAYNRTLIKYWGVINTTCDLLQCDSSIELEFLYRQQITRHKSKKSQAYFTHRLKDLHAFATPLLKLPPLSDEFFHDEPGKKHTRAGLVDEPLFAALLQHISTLTDINKSSQLALKTICILSYRAGLRVSELHKLQVMNLEQSSTGWLDIRNNRYGNNKTASSLRKVPIYPLLLEHEKHIVEDYIRHKIASKANKTAPLLTLGEDTSRPFDRFSVSNYVGQALKALSGEEHFVFYHLRHSCLSRLQLMLEIAQPHELLPYLCPYDGIQLSKIQNLLFKKTLTKGYWEIAAFAGHETPEVSFNHYFHMSDLLAAPDEKHYEKSLTISEAMRRGLTTRRQYKKLKRKYGKVTSRHCLIRFNKTLNISLIKDAVTLTDKSIVMELRKKPIINIDICYQVLEAISNNIDIQAIAHKYCLDQDIIKKWHSNSRYLKSLITQSRSKCKSQEDCSHSRHFSLSRSRSLVPGPLKTALENKYAEQFVTKLRTQYKLNRENISKEMVYSLTHTYVNHSGVTFDHPEKLTQFLQTFEFAIPRSHWRAVKLYMQASTLKNEWQKATKGMNSIVEKPGSTTGRTGHGTVRLELISPNEKQYISNGKFQKYSSHLLIYLMYMTYVMLNKP